MFVTEERALLPISELQIAASENSQPKPAGEKTTTGLPSFRSMKGARLIFMPMKRLLTGRRIFPVAYLDPDPTGR